MYYQWVISVADDTSWLPHSESLKVKDFQTFQELFSTTSVENLSESFRTITEKVYGQIFLHRDY